MEETLPKAIYYFVGDKNYQVVQWRDTYWFRPNKNSLYMNGDRELYAEDEKFLEYDIGETLKIFNPKTKEWDFVSFEEKDFFCRHSAFEEKIYLGEFEKYVSVDYEDHHYVYVFDVATYLKDNFGDEIVLTEDDFGRYVIKVSGVKKKLETLMEYQENQIGGLWSDKDSKGKMGFFSYNEAYSFVSEIYEEMSKIPTGTKYSDIYDKILSGEMSKEEFLLEIIK